MDAISQQLQQIKQLFRQHMNGVGAHSMRRKGLNYRFNYGIPFTELQQIAQEFQPNLKLAQALWDDVARESKILAILLLPRKVINTALVKKWMQSIDNQELAEYASKYLFPFQPDASVWALRQLQSPNPISQLVGIHTLSSICFINAEPLKGMKKELFSSIDTVHRQAESDANIPLLHAIANLYGRIEGKLAR